MKDHSEHSKKDFDKENNKHTHPGESSSLVSDENKHRLRHQAQQPIETHSKHKGHSTEDMKRRFFVSLILTVPIIISSHMIQESLGLHDTLQYPGDKFVVFILSTLIFFYGGMPFLIGLYREMKILKPGMMTLISIAISIAWLYSTAVIFGLKGEDFFWELATLIDIMLLGHWLEMRSIMSASRSLEELQKLLPDKASRIDESGNITEVDISLLRNGDLLLIRPGEKIPADGIIIEGSSSLNESMITGESNPVFKERGASVTGGSINGERSLKVKIEKTGDQTFLSQVMQLVKQAQESKSKTENLADRAAFWLTLTAITAGGVTMTAWLLSGADFNFALSRTVTVMIITCPHALGLAIPLVVSISTALAAGKGLLLRNREAFEEARKIKAVVFDKTGTLTKGEFGITEVTIYDHSFDREKIINYAAAVETESEHPIARAIVKSAEKKYQVKNFNSIPGKGAEGNVEGAEVKVVSPGYLKENKITSPSENRKGETTVYVIINNKIAGSISLTDIVREESVEAVRQLKKMGIKTMMLSGDNNNVAAAVAQEVGLDEYFAEVLPRDKAEKIREVQSRGFITAMVGDGVNDAPALAAADIGIAIGAGTDVAVETADIILVRNNPGDVVSLISFAKRTYRKMIQNLLWATGYNIIAIPLAAGVLYSSGINLSPALGAVLMSVSTIIVAVNSRLLKR